MGVYALTDAQGVITNRIMLDDPADFTPPAGFSLVAGADAYAIGGSIVGGTYTPPPAPPPPPVDLVAYANARQWATATGGRVLMIAGAPVPFSTSDTSMGLITGKAARFQQANPPASVQWQTGETSFVTIAAADFMTAATQIADFVQSTFDALPGIFADIASGKITTPAQIDQRFAAL